MHKSIHSWWDAYRVYLLLEGLSAMAFQLVATLYVVFYARTVGLDVFQIVLMGTIFETTIFCFEIPTGVLADTYSRRLSVIIGFALSGCALALGGFFPSFAVIVLMEVLFGIGLTFISGAAEAWISDEIGEARATQAFIRAAQVKTLMGMAGIVVSVLLASISLNLTFIIGGLLLLALAALLAVIMPETGFRPRPSAERRSWRAFFATFGAGVKLIRTRWVLLPILLIQWVYAFHGEGFDHLWQKHMLDNIALPLLGTADPIIWFGVMALGVNGLGIGLNELVRRRINLKDDRVTARALAWSYGAMVIGIVIFSLAESFSLALLAYWLVMGARATSDPISKVWLNQNIEPPLRATLFSMFGQVGSVGEIVGGPPIGMIGRLFSVRAALFSSGVVLALVLPLLAMTLRRRATLSTLAEG